LNPATLVARADKINEYLQLAFNALRYQYAQRELEPPEFEWNYDSKTLILSAIRIILDDDSMAEILMALCGWQAARSLDHIMMVILNNLFLRRQFTSLQLR